MKPFTLFLENHVLAFKNLPCLKEWDYKWASSASSSLIALTVLYTFGETCSTSRNVKCVQEENANQSMVCLYTSAFSKWTLQKPPWDIVLIYIWYLAVRRQTCWCSRHNCIFSSVNLECLDCCWQAFRLKKKVSALK